MNGYKLGVLLVLVGVFMCIVAASITDTSPNGGDPCVESYRVVGFVDNTYACTPGQSMTTEREQDGRTAVRCHCPIRASATSPVDAGVTR